MTTTFGSSNPDSDPIPKEEIEKALGRRDKATLDGCLRELDIVKQKLDNCYEKLARMTGLYGTLQNQFQQFEMQRARELTLKVAGGSTTPSDWDGSND